jgi:16S rRNA processing protein RimM
VVKTQGRHGEVAIELHSDVPGRFQPGLRLFALGKNEGRRELRVEEVWPHKGQQVLKFEGIDTISEAEALVGCELQVPREERAPLELGFTYVSDLIGCAVFDSGREVGKVADVTFNAGEAPLLIVSAGKKEYEIPYAEAYLASVNLERKKIEMRLPEGLLELDAPLTEAEKRQHRKASGRG